MKRHVTSSSLVAVGMLVLATVQAGERPEHRVQSWTDPYLQFILDSMPPGPEFSLGRLAMLLPPDRSDNELRSLIPAGPKGTRADGEHGYQRQPSKDTLVRALFLKGGELTVRTRGGNVVTVNVRDLAGEVKSAAIPAIVGEDVVLYRDFTGDGVPDLMTRDFAVFDAARLTRAVPPEDVNEKRIGVWWDRLIALPYPSRAGMIRFQDLAGKHLDSFRLTGKSPGRTCEPESSFYLAWWPSRGESPTTVYGIDQSGIAWARQLPVRAALPTVNRIGSVIFIAQESYTYLISARDGSILWEQHPAQPNSAGSVAIGCAGGFAMLEAGKLAFRDWQGMTISSLALTGAWRLPTSTPISGIGRWGKVGSSYHGSAMFARQVPVVQSEYIPLVSDDSFLLVSARTGSRQLSMAWTSPRGCSFYDEKGCYLGGPAGFRAYDWAGNRMNLPDLAPICYPIRVGDRAAFYCCRGNTDILLSPEAAERLADMPRMPRTEAPVSPGRSGRHDR